MTELIHTTLYTSYIENTSNTKQKQTKMTDFLLS